MNVNIEFDKMKRVILLAAEKQGLSSNFLQENWSINYNSELDNKFIKNLYNLNEEMKLLNQAIDENDLLTAISAIVMAKAYSHNLMNFFENINDDIVQLGWGKELKDKWPAIPEDYKVPEHYDYEDTNKPYSQQISDESSL